MRYRRNPSPMEILVGLVRKTGRDRLADLIIKYQDDPDVAPLLSKIADKVAELVAAKAAREAAGVAETPLTDKQAWKRLAEIAKDVGKAKGWPAELIRALQDVFMEKSAAA